FGGSSQVHYWKLCGAGDQHKRYVRLPLTSMQAPNGNTVTYTWATEDKASGPSGCPGYTRAIRLAEVAYNDSTTKVELTYGARDDFPSGYDRNDVWQFYTDTKLTSVAVRVKQQSDGAWQTVRTYNLGHSSGPATAVSQKVLNLDYIEELSGGNPLPRTTISYTQDAFVWEDDYGAVAWIDNGYGGRVTFTSQNRGSNSKNPHNVLTRTESSGQSGAADGVWSYSYSGWVEDVYNLDLAKGWQQVDVTLPNGAVERRLFKTIQTASNGVNIDHLAGREWRLRVSSGGSELSRVDTTWISSTASLPLSGYSGMAEDTKPRFVYAEQVNAYRDAAIVSQQLLGYEVSRQGGAYQFGNLTQSQEYDCSSGSCGAEPVRTTYAWYYPRTDGGRWVVNRPGRTDLYKLRSGAAGASLEGQTLLYYDQTSDYTTPPTNGQLRLQKVKLDGANWAETEYTYWANGNLKRVYDPLDRFTETFYDPWHQAFPVCVKDALGYQTRTKFYGVPGSQDSACPSDSGAAAWSGSNPVQGRFFGQVEEARDPNDSVTAYEYDWWGRVTGMWRPGETKGAHSATAVLEYTNYVASTQTPFRVRERQRDDASGGGAAATYLDAWTFLDGLGRVVQTQAEAAATGEIVLANQRYDGLGQVVTATVAYTVAATGGSYQSPDWAKPRRQYTYDGLGRIRETVNPDNTKVRTYYNHVKTAVIDERNHLTIHEADGLARMVRAKQFTGAYAGNPGWTDTPYAL
ncbi:MAG: hypothetical protein GX605_08965, partial [Chloroflexi bacterium]|nr:hypothetical protein [Chloroflexota bacterium]